MPSSETRDQLRQTPRSKPILFSRFPTFMLLAVLLVLVSIPVVRSSAVQNDFAIYWVAGKKVLAGGNPYAPEHLLLQQQIWFRGNEPLVLRNPPWALPVIIPFALLDYAPAQKIWLLFGLAAIITSVYWLSRLYGNKHNPRVGWIAAATFLPVAVVLAIGQIGPLLLLGIAGFLRFDTQKKYLWAGAFLSLLTLKPHLGLLVWPALLLYTIRSRQYRTVAALLGIVALASAVAILLHPSIFRDYAALWTEGSGFVAELNPTLGGVLNQLLHTRWAQYIPAALSMIWLVVYWWPRSRAWSWLEAMPLLLLISLLASWYGWFFDQVVLLPCVMQAMFTLSQSRLVNKVLVAATYLAINLIVLLLILNHRTTFWYAWTMPAWLLLHWWVRSMQTTRQRKTVVPAT